MSVMFVARPSGSGGFHDKVWQWLAGLVNDDAFFVCLPMHGRPGRLQAGQRIARVTFPHGVFFRNLGMELRPSVAGVTQQSN